MTRVKETKSGRTLVIIEDEPDKICAFCGITTDTRPYGPGFQQICFACGMKDEENTRKRMNHILFGEPFKETEC